ncbi:MAG: hypothetical protein H0T79_15515, partial [Deltaproteobacteria bacterium]|nr:hypothetical protein [Deltaproteobacteria bacterium]
MKRVAVWIALGLGVVEPTLALASPVPLVTVPANWKLDREKSTTMNNASQTVAHFGSAPSVDVTEAYFPEDGIALIVTRSTATTLPDGRDAAIAAVVDEIETSISRAETAGTTITDKTGDRAVTLGGKQLVVTISGTDTGASVRMRSRMVVAADATSLVAVTGMCIARDGSTPALVEQCTGALATIDPGIATTDRVALAFPPPPAVTNAPTMSVPDHAAPPRREPARLDDGSRVKMQPIQVAQDRGSDRRPVYVGIGLVVLALAFWWNRKQRDRFAGEDRATAARGSRAAGSPTTDEPAPSSADGDADDLHAAAAAA